MRLKKYQPIIEVLFLSALVYVAHKVFFFLNQDNPKYQNFHFQIEVVYGFFLLCAVVLIWVVIKVKEKNLDHVGYAFLWVTFIKMALSYTVLHPILHSENINSKTEKMDFFVIFIFFLTIETAVTIRLLNHKR